MLLLKRDQLISDKEKQIKQINEENKILQNNLNENTKYLNNTIQNLKESIETIKEQLFSSKKEKTNLKHKFLH